jgi:hypothetical protein
LLPPLSKDDHSKLRWVNYTKGNGSGQNVRSGNLVFSGTLG